jgi:hypothetical protein
VNALLPLYEIEETLAVFAETEEGVPPEQGAEFLQEFAAILNSAVEKRDRMRQFMAHLEVDQLDRCGNPPTPGPQTGLYPRSCETEYVTCVIQSLGTDGKGKYKKLEGNTVTFSLKRCPPSVGIIECPAFLVNGPALSVVPANALIGSQRFQNDRARREISA